MIILASNSPRRKELMKEYITPSFLILPSDIDESVYYDNDPIIMSQNTAKAKGDYIYKSHKDDLVISADTIVVINKEILGKPKDINDAINMLKKLKGKTHEVITSYYIINKEKSILRSVISKVIFKNVNDNVLKEYIRLFPPLDKAGSYGIQDSYFHDNVLKGYEGSLTNIIGLPIEKITEDLREFSVIL